MHGRSLTMSWKNGILEVDFVFALFLISCCAYGRPVIIGWTWSMGAIKQGGRLEVEDEVRAKASEVKVKDVGKVPTASGSRFIQGLKSFLKVKRTFGFTRI